MTLNPIEGFETTSKCFSAEPNFLGSERVKMLFPDLTNSAMFDAWSWALSVLQPYIEGVVGATIALFLVSIVVKSFFTNNDGE